MDGFRWFRLVCYSFTRAILFLDLLGSWAPGLLVSWVVLLLFFCIGVLSLVSLDGNGGEVRGGYGFRKRFWAYFGTSKQSAH